MGVKCDIVAHDRCCRAHSNDAGSQVSAMSQITFTTLGPPGTNHEFVTRKYLSFHGLTATAKLRLSASADEASERIRSGTADYFVLCAVHPDAPRAVGRHYREVFVVDSFISPSLPLAVLTRASIEHPTSIGVLHPSTTDYIDASNWDRVVHIMTGTLHTVAEGLLAGNYDSGLVYRNYCDLFPGLLRIDQDLGSPDDAWLVLGRERTFVEPVQAWRDAPVARQFARLAADA
jgi:hypothetical protein